MAVKFAPVCTENPDSNEMLLFETYCVTFYLSLGNTIGGYAVNNIGAYFSPLSIGSANYGPLPYIPQITNKATNSLIDTSGWMRVSEKFTAQGGERYITIGNFNDNATSDTVFVQKTIESNISYYYIDDVSVIHLDAGAGNTTGVCNGLGVTLGRVAQSGITYKWQPAIGLSDATIAQPTATPTVTTTYYLTAALNSSGCTKTDSVMVYYIPTAPTASVSLSAGKLCTGEKGTATAILNSTANPSRYDWSNGVSGSGFQITDLGVGSYTVTITDALSCTAIATTTLVSKTPCECNAGMFIPNIFSPNNDSKNDVLYIEGNGLTNIYWGIYDRWGNLVFETKDIAKGWDGTINGIHAEPGTYVYYLRGICVKTNSAVSLKGTVSLIR